MAEAGALEEAVVESSLRYDRKAKASLYAEAGVAEYWVVNLVDLFPAKKHPPF